MTTLVHQNETKTTQRNCGLTALMSHFSITALLHYANFFGTLSFCFTDQRLGQHNPLRQQQPQQQQQLDCNGSAAGGARANVGGVKRTGPNATAAAAPSSWKRCRQEETAKQGASNSVLMNLLVSGCDVSAGYVCFTSPKSKNATAAAVASVASQQRHSRFYEQHQRRNVTAK